MKSVIKLKNQLLKIKDILSAGQKKFYRLSNGDGKVWMLPADNLSISLELYQPSGIKGRLLKRVFPYVHRISSVRKVVGAEIIDVALNDEIYTLAKSVFKTEKLEYSIFGGTPSVHQKIIVQFFAGRKILGYGKLTASDEISRLFFHEKDLLSNLRQKGLIEIPECLFCQRLSSGIYLFIQSTIKPVRAVSPAVYSTAHEEFLRELMAKTESKTQFEHSDFYRSLVKLGENLINIPEPFKNPIKNALAVTMGQFRGRQLIMSAFHADFTPWNMFLHNGNLYVFDWEYGQQSYPPMLDRYHFYIQQAIHVKHQSPDEIRREIQSVPWFTPCDLRCYLLDIISRFLCRENGSVSSELKSMLEIWTALLP